MKIYQVRKALAESYLQQGNYVDGLSMLMGAIDILPEEEKEKKLLLLDIAGETYSALQDYTHSNDYWVEALHLAHALADTNLVVRLYYQLAINHKALGNCETSLGYYYSALGLAQTYLKPNWTFSCYLEIGEINLNLKDYFKAREFFTLALELAQKQNYEYGIFCI